MLHLHWRKPKYRGAAVASSFNKRVSKAKMNVRLDLCLKGSVKTSMSRIAGVFDSLDSNCSV